MPSKAKYAATLCCSISLIILGYYLILSNQPVLSGLREGDRFLSAIVNTSIIVFLATLMGLTWDSIDKLSDSKNLDSKKGG